MLMDPLFAHSSNLVILHSILKCAVYSLSPLIGYYVLVPVYRNKILKGVSIGVYIFNFLLQVTSIFTGWTFYIDSSNFCHNGPLYFIYAIVYWYSILLVLFGSIAYGSRFPNHNLGSLIGLISIVDFGVIIRLFHSEIQLSYLCVSIACSLLLLHYIEFSRQRTDDIINRQRNDLERDPLTNLLSRYSYNRRIERFFDDDHLEDDLVVCIFDINGLKNVNDNIGHLAGDIMIAGAAKNIKKVVGEYGNVYRYGGDEFIAFLNLPLEKADEFENQLNNETLAWSAENKLNLHVSLGYCASKDNPDYDIQALINKADKMMYANKQSFYNQSI